MMMRNATAARHHNVKGEEKKELTKGAIRAFATTASLNAADEEDESKREELMADAVIGATYDDDSKRAADELNASTFAAAVIVGTGTAAVDLTTDIIKGTAKGVTAVGKGVGQGMKAGVSAAGAGLSKGASAGAFALKNPAQAARSTAAGLRNAPGQITKGAAKGVGALGDAVKNAPGSAAKGASAFGGALGVGGGGGPAFGGKKGLHGLAALKGAVKMVEEENKQAKKRGLPRWMPKPRDEEANKAKRALQDMLLYIIFMCFYVAATMRGLNDSHPYYMTEALRGQLIGVEMTANYVPNFAKTWEDIATVEEWYTWLDSAFKHTAFSPNTFDGSVRHGAGKPRLDFKAGYVLSFNKIVGTVRVGQARVKPTACASDQIPPELKWGTNKTDEHEYTCFGNLGEGGAWDRSHEDRDSFGNFTIVSPGGKKVSTAFHYDGIFGTDASPCNAGTVDSLRKLNGQEWSSTYTTLGYDTPSHWVLLDPREGLDANSKIIAAMMRANYADLHTRALFVDFTVYNPQLDRMVNARLVAETPSGGGVVPSHEFHNVRVYSSHTSDDKHELVLAVVIALFYLYYTAEETVEFFQDGPRKYFSSTLNIAMVINIIFFVIQVYYKVRSLSDAPDLALVDNGRAFTDFRAAMHSVRLSSDIGAINTFLNWFKMIAYLSYIPTFALLTDTLRVAAPEIFGFSFVFAIVFFGFAQAHTMVFGQRVAGFRTLSNSMYMLTRSLLGDFDFEEMRRSEPTIGPLFFVLFICLAVFVILNMLIAIVSDAYSTCRDEMRRKKKVNIVEEMSLYIRDTIESIPYVGPRIKQARFKATEMALKAKELAEQKALAAAGGVKMGLKAPKMHKPGFLKRQQTVAAKGSLIVSDDAKTGKKTEKLAIDDDDDGTVDAVLDVKSSVALTKTPKGGVHQVFGREIDIDGDGEADMVAFNKDGNTTGVDTVLKVSKEGLDHALGGSLKAELISTHHDGHSELIAIDTTGDGDADTVLRVDDTEGAYAKLTDEQVEGGQRLDLDDDGDDDMIAVDTTGDGHLDTVVAIDHNKLQQQADVAAHLEIAHAQDVERRLSAAMATAAAADDDAKGPKGVADLVLQRPEPIEGGSVVDMALLESVCNSISVVTLGADAAKSGRICNSILAHAAKVLGADGDSTTKRLSDTAEI